MHANMKSLKTGNLKSFRETEVASSGLLDPGDGLIFGTEDVFLVGEEDTLCGYNDILME